MTDDTRKADVWMPLLIDRYLGDTSLLTTEQHGAYMLLLMAMWKAGGVLPDNDVQLASAAKLTTAKWRKLKPALWGFFRVDDRGSITQKRLHAELDRASQRSTAGQKAARSRWQNDANAYAIACAKDDAKGDAKGDAKQDAKGHAEQHANGMPSACSPPLHPESSEKETVVSLSSPRATSAGEATKAMRAAGIGDVNPNHPDLIAMLAQGMTISELVSASTTALQSHADKPFKYALKVARSERDKSAAREKLAPQSTRSKRLSAFVEHELQPENDDGIDHVRARG